MKSFLHSQLSSGNIYARPCLSGLISANAYISYCLLCEIIELLIKPTFNSEEMEELFRLLNEHHKLFATVYGGKLQLIII